MTTGISVVSPSPGFCLVIRWQEKIEWETAEVTSLYAGTCRSQHGPRGTTIASRLVIRRNTINTTTVHGLSTQTNKCCQMASALWIKKHGRLPSIEHKCRQVLATSAALISSFDTILAQRFICNTRDGDEFWPEARPEIPPGCH